MRHALRALAASLLIAGPTVLAFFSGGFFEKPRLVAAVGAWLILAVAALVCERPLPASRSGRIALLGLVLLTAWTALSYEWAPLGDRAQQDIQRLLLYLGFFTAAVALLRQPWVRRWLEPMLALGTFVVVAYGLSNRLLPDQIAFQRSQSAGGRLEQPLTYWNAMGCLAAVGAVLCIRIAADERRGRVERAAAAFASVSLGVGVYISFSRGALLALVAGVALLLTLAPSLRNQARATAVIVVAGGIAAFVANRLPHVKSFGRLQVGDAGQGAEMLIALVVLSAIAAAIVFVLPLARPPDGLRRAARLSRPVVVGGLVVVFAAGLAGVASLEKSPKARTQGTTTNAKRFASADTTRYAYWGVAFDEFKSSPLEGRGTGGFAVDWRKKADRTETAVDAHSLYLETLGELGIVGLACLALFLGGIGVAASRAYLANPGATVGLAAALGVWALHAGLDWDWEMPALTGIALLAAAALVGWADEPAPDGG